MLTLIARTSNYELPAYTLRQLRTKRNVNVKRHHKLVVHRHRSVRSSIASALGQLGERSVAHDLVPLLSNEQIDGYVRSRIASALGMLTDDEMIVRSLAELISTSDIADDIHRALWSMSRQAGVSIYVSNGPKRKQVEIVKWSSA